MPARTIGYAGLKDARAITVQRMSIENVPVEEAMRLDVPGVRILDAAYHSNKLRMGHLAGNRFVIRVRRPNDGAYETTRQALAILERDGVPNFFGMQRFSRRRNGHLIGRAMILGEWDEVLAHYLGRPQPHEHAHIIEAREAYDAGEFDRARRLLPYTRYRGERQVLGALLRGLAPEAAFNHIIPRMWKLFPSAYQSLLFNRILSRRLPDLRTLMDGEVVLNHRGGGVFHAPDAAIEQTRADAFEISPSGPLFGAKMVRPTGVPREIEDDVLREEGFEPDRMAAVFRSMNGWRRAYRVQVTETKVERHDSDDVVVSFRLPSGSYATIVMDEITKTRTIDLFEHDEDDSGDETTGDSA